MSSEIKRKITAQCRVSEEEYNEIEKKADKIGLSVSSYLRMVCLMAEVNVTLKQPMQSDND
jgi:predicted DNA binding CopG/RHH family protein